MVEINAHRPLLAARARGLAVLVLLAIIVIAVLGVAFYPSRDAAGRLDFMRLLCNVNELSGSPRRCEFPSDRVDPRR